MVYTKTWIINNVKYTIQINKNEITIEIYDNNIDTFLYKISKPNRFDAYIQIFSVIGEIRYHSNNRKIIFTLLDTRVSIDIISYEILIDIANMTVKSINDMSNLYQCFDTVLTFLEGNE